MNNKQSSVTNQDNLPASCPAEGTGKRRRFGTLRAAVIAVLVFTLICGIIYPVTMTWLSETAFPYEAKGSVVTVTLADGTKRDFGSSVTGQGFDQPYYLLGRVNNGAPTNQSPEGNGHAENMAKRLEYLRKLGYQKDGLPQNLITSSGSGLDPHISPADAEWQVEYLAKNRFDYGWRLVKDGEGKVVGYIRLPETTADAADVITGSLASVAVLDEPIVEGESKTYCSQPVTTTLYFAPAETDAGLTVCYDYDAAAYEGYVRSVIETYTEGRWLGIFGDPTVNVLLVNLALDGLL